MENKLEEQIKVLIDKAEDKELIDALVNLNTAAVEMTREYDALTAKHVELQKSYKDAILHTSFQQAPKNDPVETKPVSFEELLNQYANKK